MGQNRVGHAVDRADSGTCATDPDQPTGCSSHRRSPSGRGDQRSTLSRQRDTSRRRLHPLLGIFDPGIDLVTDDVFGKPDADRHRSSHRPAERSGHGGGSGRRCDRRGIGGTQGDAPGNNASCRKPTIDRRLNQREDLVADRRPGTTQAHTRRAAERGCCRAGIGGSIDRGIIDRRLRQRTDGRDARIIDIRPHLKRDLRNQLDAPGRQEEIVDSRQSCGQHYRCDRSDLFGHGHNAVTVTVER